MQENLFKWFYQIRQYRFVDLTQQTLTRLFPFAIIGSFLSAFRKTVLDDEGFVNNVFNIPDILPKYDVLNHYFQNLTHLTLGILGILAAYYMAELTVRKYSHRIYQAGITSAVAYVLVFNPANLVKGHMQLAALTRYTGMRGLLVGLIFGYLVGSIFGRVARWGQKHDRHADNVNNYGMIGVVALVLAGGLVLNVGLNALVKFTPITNGIETVVSTLQRGTFGMTLLGTIVTTGLRWVGLSGPFEFDNSFTSPTANANLMFALKHHSPWQVPNPFTEESLYDSFGLFGGVGGILALGVAILLFSNNRKQRATSHISMLPTIFGSGQGLMIGLPVLFNPIYLLPFVLVPTVNVCLGALLICCKAMPPSIYPVPIGTPGPLIAFIGSGGNFVALLAGIGMFIIDVLIYIPFVKLDKRIQTRLNERH
ncbi:PTS sugar transporter subunit IIC [Weissella viridescens]|uniref:PTS sugar transporter subunit IIC n=1 Tax=Weissella viridescens TaxID=1629 RepID=A0A3P2RE30_WEIVI|nr:PTS transporter subunit EIIC [Weissella viridescens]RRG17645.1 PTS sugar transporter subunit IIC [Weissella viridescens]